MHENRAVCTKSYVQHADVINKEHKYEYLILFYHDIKKHRS